ncbi:unnamed protein product [Soboliphyme baturini]|uniref:HEPN domain-containing protein n=1 Tax=Soboliphyme baturini TaxID=241478 RepID=A0A183IUU5_9BILA|nr:unnamed protein product [Soboliphyme baturini]
MSTYEETELNLSKSGILEATAEYRDLNALACRLEVRKDIPGGHEWKQRVFYSHGVCIEACKAAAKALPKAKVGYWEKFGEVLESNFHTVNKMFCQTIRRLRGEK